MDAASKPHGTRSPQLASAAACVGVAVVVGLSIKVGFEYWWPRDEALAILTVGAELVAFGGLSVAVWKWSVDRRNAIGALLVTAIAAAWCGLTMFQKIEADTRAEALAAAHERPAYVFAANAARTAGALLESRLERPNPRPECSCPETIRAWEASEAAAIDRLRTERDEAVAQMEAATPQPKTDYLALARGAGIEIAKLLGFMAFGLATVQPAPQSGSQGFSWMRRLRIPFLIGAGALAATPAHAGQAPETTGFSTFSEADQIVCFPATNKKSQAFSMRGRFRPDEIAEKVGVHQSTVYRWFADRDRQHKAA